MGQILHISAPSYQGPLAPNNSARCTGHLPMAASVAANAAAPRKKRIQGPWMCAVEQLAVLRTGIAVSISSLESTTDKLEKNMGEQWPEQLERATQEHGWSEKNIKKKFGSEPWTIDTAKSARVELKCLWPHYQALKAWCLNVANPQYGSTSSF